MNMNMNSEFQNLDKKVQYFWYYGHRFKFVIALQWRMLLAFRLLEERDVGYVLFLRAQAKFIIQYSMISLCRLH